MRDILAIFSLEFQFSVFGLYLIKCRYDKYFIPFIIRFLLTFVPLEFKT